MFSSPLMSEQFISNYIDFLNASMTPYHATNNIQSLLKDKNFQRVHKVPKLPGKYYMKFNKTLILAFTIPSSPKIIKIVATHNDSPVLKIKPNGISDSVSLKPYGGGLWHTWFDRNLGIAGQIIDDKMQSHIIDVYRPVVYIPHLAIHLDKNGMYKNGFMFNKETHLRGISGFNSVNEIWALSKVLEKQSKTLPDQHPTSTISSIQDSVKNLDSNTDSKGDSNKTNCSITETNSLNTEVIPSVNQIAKTNKINKTDKNSKMDENGDGFSQSSSDSHINILSHDLSLYDLDRARLGGSTNQFIFGARQDNLLSTFCAIEAINTLCDTSINMVCVFDAEEIGSETISGAKSQLFINAINGLVSLFNLSLKDSLVVSCDVAHALNLNYSEMYESNNAPLLGKGMVIKYSNRYATNTYTSAIIKKLFSKYQEFMPRNDCVGGGTIGPMIVCGTGIQGVDIGAPLLGMHSIKEVSHVDDVKSNYDLFCEFFKNQMKWN